MNGVEITGDHCGTVYGTFSYEMTGVGTQTGVGAYCGGATNWVGIDGVGMKVGYGAGGGTATGVGTTVGTYGVGTGD
jgi:hypothetical protein